MWHYTIKHVRSHWLLIIELNDEIVRIEKFPTREKACAREYCLSLMPDPDKIKL